ncbi:helicase [bacterium]|nr:helicase [bacterium]
MSYAPANPLIVQGDRTIFLEVDSPLFESARDAIAPFAELEKSPEHIHTYRITPLSLWNAAAAGMTADAMIENLQRFTKFPIPPNVPIDIRDMVARYGKVRLVRSAETGTLRLECDDAPLFSELARIKGVREFLGDKAGDDSYEVSDAFRGLLKQGLITAGYPAEDLAGYTEGADLPIAMREVCNSGMTFHLREYQKQAVEAFHADGGPRGGSGVIVLPCGAGKTIVGLAAMAKLSKKTLVLTTSTTSVEQWRREILDKTDLKPDDVAIYTGYEKAIRPVTLATYQILTWRPDKGAEFPHFGLFEKNDWGLVIYDEVHLLPAPVFRVTADLQARRRLGLTATLVREDQREGDVFSLIGPKKFDVPWRVLEKKGWIAQAICHEVRIAMPADHRVEYAVAELKDKYRLAAENPRKDEIVGQLLARHDRPNDRVLVIGQYLDQLERVAAAYRMPIITGSTPNVVREQIYEAFRKGVIRQLVLSKVGNFAVDLPDANCMIQISGSFGSRQEEAQRLGRILRPKSDGESAAFYSLVSRDTREMDFAQHRQLFLTEQGYGYDIIDETAITEDPMLPADPESLSPEARAILELVAPKVKRPRKNKIVEE